MILMNISARRSADLLQRMSIHHLHAFNRDLDIVIERSGLKLKLTINDGGKILVDKLINAGESVEVKIAEN